MHKNSKDLAKLNKEARNPRFVGVVAEKKCSRVAKNAKAPETSNGNPYAFMAKAGRGEEDKNTNFYGTFGGSYGPVSSLVNGGLPGLSTGVDPRAWGGPNSVVSEANDRMGAPVPGVSARGFTYSAPNLPLSSLYSSNGFCYILVCTDHTTIQPVGQENGRNYTQFGPHPFGPYGVAGFASKSVIPKHLPLV